LGEEELEVVGEVVGLGQGWVDVEFGGGPIQEGLQVGG